MKTLRTMIWLASLAALVALPWASLATVRGSSGQMRSSQAPRQFQTSRFQTSRQIKQAPRTIQRTTPKTIRKTTPTTFKKTTPKTTTKKTIKKTPTTKKTVKTTPKTIKKTTPKTIKKTGLTKKTPISKVKKAPMTKLNKNKINKISKNFNKGRGWWNRWNWSPWFWGSFGLWGGYLYGSWWNWGWGWGGCTTCCDVCSPWIYAGPSVCTGCAAPQMVLGEQPESSSGDASDVQQRLEQLQQQLEIFKDTVEKESTKTEELIEQLRESKQTDEIKTYLDERLQLLETDLKQTNASIDHMQKAKGLKSNQKQQAANNLGERITTIENDIKTIKGLKDDPESMQEYLEDHLASLQKDLRQLNKQGRNLATGALGESSLEETVA
jgi:hypothetical protein